MSEMLMLREQVGELSEKVGALDAKVEAIKAVTDRMDEVRTAEVSAMFAKHNAIDERLRIVERDYVKQTAFERFTASIDDKLGKHDARIIGGQVFNAKVVGVGLAVNFVGLAGLAALVLSFGK